MGDGKLVRSEFVDLCIDVMWGLPVANLEMAVENYLGAKSMETRRNQAYWQAAPPSQHSSLPIALVAARVWVCAPPLAGSFLFGHMSGRHTGANSMRTVASGSASRTAS